MVEAGRIDYDQAWNRQCGHGYRVYQIGSANPREQEFPVREKEKPSLLQLLYKLTSFYEAYSW